MKILLLNPHIDAEHKIAITLRSKGFAVLVARDTEEAWQTCQLHGTSLDLAVIHREWGKQKDGGIKFIERLRADPVQADLPFILTSEDWSEVECAIHQKSANGANAYVRWPYSDTQLLEIIQKIFPDSLLPAKGEMTLTNTKGPAVSDLSTVAMPALSEPSAVPIGPPAGPPGAPPNSPFGLPFAPPGGAPGAPPLAMATASAPIIAAPEGAGPALEFTSSQIMPPALDLSSVALTAPPKTPAAPALEAGSGLVLEDPSSMIVKSEGAEATRPSDIVLEAPVAPTLPLPDLTSGAGTQATQALASDAGPMLDLGTIGGTQATQALPSADLTGAPVPILDTSSAQISVPLDTNATSVAESEAPAPSKPKVPQKPKKPEPVEAPEPTSEFHTVALSPPGDGPSLSPEPSYDIRGDREVAVQMPYLFSKTAGMAGQGKGNVSPIPALLGDAIIPGAAGQSPDVETLKKYLTLREHDVAVLSAQLRAMQDRISTLEDSLGVEKATAAELIAGSRVQKQKLEDQERAASVGQKQLLAEIEDVRFQLKVKTDQAKILEAREQEGNDEMEKLKERVRSDIRKIRVHERELENRLEVLKRDSEALIGAREQKIIELKRKLDLIEFNMDLLQNQFSREKDTSAKLRDRLAKAAQIVRVAGGLLDAEGKATLAKIAGTDEEVAAIASGRKEAS
jgi:hypothetical protein